MYRKELIKTMDTIVRIRYCSDCDWFTQQTLHPTTRPINRCSKCGRECRGMTENCQRLGGLMDYAVDVKIPPRRYSQAELKSFYLEAGGRIEKCIDGKLVSFNRSNDLRGDPPRFG